MIARTVGLHARSVQRLLEGQNIQPVFDPVRLGARIYRRADIARFVAERGATNAGEKSCEIGAVSGQKSAVHAENGAFGEIYHVNLLILCVAFRAGYVDAIIESMTYV